MISNKPTIPRADDGSDPHIVINAISNTGAGAFSVACQLLTHMGRARPDWRFTLALIDRLPIHDEMKQEGLPTNCHILRAPRELAKLLPRIRWERANWPRLVEEMNVSVLMQMNAMLVPGVTAPMFCHNQDPFPYRPEAWDGMKWRLIAFLRRQQHRKALKGAAFVGFTSQYLQQLMTSRLGVMPQNSEVFYNGLPESWLVRAATSLPAWENREPEIISVSTVGPYKRQELVMGAMARLVRRAGCEGIRYRMLGKIHSDEFGAHMLRLAKELGISDRIIMEGRVSDQRIAEALPRAKVFVLMSVCESFGIPAIEAMSYGTPVITADCCAMPEVCGDSAVLSPVDDVTALAENIYRVWTDPLQAEQLRQRGAANIQRFRWTNTANQFIDALSLVMKNAATAT